jgi:CHASE1-domain containing sensor protein
MKGRKRAWLARGYADERWLPYVVGVMTLLIAVLAAHYAQTAAQARGQLRFQSQVSDASNSIGRRLAAYVVMLRAGAGLFGATHAATREQFAAYVDRLDLARQYPGSQGCPCA